MSLDAKAWIGLIALAIVMGLLLFLPAGTILYWQAWLFLCIYFAASYLSTVYAIKNQADELERRMHAGPIAEKETSQQIIMSMVMLAFVASLVVSALDIRFGWSAVPAYVVSAGNVLVVLFFYISFLALRENRFASSTIETTSDQQVISSGIYGFIRHPMYAGLLVLFLGTPLALGSYWGILPFFIALPALIWRLVDEERLLSKNLPGYAEYRAKVRWRLIPGMY